MVLLLRSVIMVFSTDEKYLKILDRAAGGSCLKIRQV